MLPPSFSGVGLCSKLRHKTKANRQKQNQVNNGNRGGRSFGLAVKDRQRRKIAGWKQKALKISLDCSGCGLRLTEWADRQQPGEGPGHWAPVKQDTMPGG